MSISGCLKSDECLESEACVANTCVVKSCPHPPALSRAKVLLNEDDHRGSGGGHHEVGSAGQLYCSEGRYPADNETIVDIVCDGESFIDTRSGKPVQDCVEGNNMNGAD